MGLSGSFHRDRGQDFDAPYDTEIKPRICESAETRVTCTLIRINGNSGSYAVQSRVHNCAFCRNVTRNSTRITRLRRGRYGAELGRTGCALVIHQLFAAPARPHLLQWWKGRYVLCRPLKNRQQRGSGAPRTERERMLQQQRPRLRISCHIKAECAGADPAFKSVRSYTAQILWLRFLIPLQYGCLSTFFCLVLRRLVTLGGLNLCKMSPTVYLHKDIENLYRVIKERSVHFQKFILH
jgi:hypothetical protein